MTLVELNAYDRPAFVRAIGWIFESSPWVAERAWDHRPFASVGDLHTAMTDMVDAATEEERLALLRAHPDLGTRARMSDASVGEQQGAGLNRLTQSELERLRQLNAEYRRRFGFPFLFAVKGFTKHDVLDALERRCTATPRDELGEAVRQVFRIARLRLEALVGE